MRAAATRPPPVCVEAVVPSTEYCPSGEPRRLAGCARRETGVASVPRLRKGACRWSAASAAACVAASLRLAGCKRKICPRCQASCIGNKPSASLLDAPHCSSMPKCQLIFWRSRIGTALFEASARWVLPLPTLCLATSLHCGAARPSTAARLSKQLVRRDYPLNAAKTPAEHQGCEPQARHQRQGGLTPQAPHMTTQAACAARCTRVPRDSVGERDA